MGLGRTTYLVLGRGVPEGKTAYCLTIEVRCSSLKRVLGSRWCRKAGNSGCGTRWQGSTSPHRKPSCPSGGWPNKYLGLKQSQIDLNDCSDQWIVWLDTIENHCHSSNPMDVKILPAMKVIHLLQSSTFFHLNVPLSPQIIAALSRVWSTQPTCGETCNLPNRCSFYIWYLSFLNLFVSASAPSLGLFQLFWLAASVPRTASCYAVRPGFAMNHETF